MGSQNLPVPRARESLVRERIAEMLELMRSGAWERGVTVYEVAERHGVSPSTCGNEASLLAHCLDLLVGDRAIKASVIDQGLQEAADTAREICAQLRRDPDSAGTAVQALNTMVRALDSRARNIGLQGPATVVHRVEVGDGLGDKDLRSAAFELTEEDIAILAEDEVWAELQARVAAHRARTVTTTGTVVESED